VPNNATQHKVGKGGYWTIVLLLDFNGNLVLTRWLRPIAASSPGTPPQLLRNIIEQCDCESCWRMT